MTPSAADIKARQARAKARAELIARDMNVILASGARTDDQLAQLIKDANVKAKSDSDSTRVARHRK